MNNTYRCKQRREEKQRINIWDAFVTHLETTYFPGASELLDKKLIAFEYEAFKTCHSF
jgi:hypothetical protein